MSRITNIMKDGQPTGTLGSGELVWHTDMSYIDTPPTGSLLLRAGSAAGRGQHQLPEYV